MLPDRLSQVQTVEVPSPCDIAATATLLCLTPRVRRLSIWATARRRGRSDIMLVSADGLRCSRADAVAGQHLAFGVARLCVLAQPALFLHAHDRPQPRDAEPFTDLFRLFGSIDTLFLDGSRALHCVRSKESTELVRVRVRHLSRGRRFTPSTRLAILLVRTLRSGWCCSPFLANSNAEPRRGMSPGSLASCVRKAWRVVRCASPRSSAAP